MITIKLHIPDDLATKVQSLTSNAEAYIIDLLRSKINELKMPGLLEEEYKMAAKENDTLVKEFATVDLEGWDNDY